MTDARLLGSPQRIQSLAERLNAHEFIRRFDQSDEQEAWVLATALSEIEEIFRDVLTRYLPDLLRAETAPETQDALVALLEEFRHATYHMREPGFFADLVDD